MLRILLGCRAVDSHRSALASPRIGFLEPIFINVVSQTHERPLVPPSPALLSDEVALRCSQDSAIPTSIPPFGSVPRGLLPSTGSLGSVPRLPRY